MQHFAFVTGHGSTTQSRGSSEDTDEGDAMMRDNEIAAGSATRGPKRRRVTKAVEIPEGHRSFRISVNGFKQYVFSASPSSVLLCFPAIVCVCVCVCVPFCIHDITLQHHALLETYTAVRPCDIASFIHLRNQSRTRCCHAVVSADATLSDFRRLVLESQLAHPNAIQEGAWPRVVLLSARPTTMKTT